MASGSSSQNSAMKLQVGEKPPLAQHDSSVLDLAFAMDVTSSMGGYIVAAQQSIRTIVEEIVSAEKSDVRLALVEYRDHPPEEKTFVTRTHKFTDSVKKMKKHLDSCRALGGGDTPEAVADALHDVLKLSWRPKATKICVLISDAPPHGLMGSVADHFPEGCPAGLDPVEIVNKMAEKNITVYSVGCEPSVNECRDFYMALAHITGGQYVPLKDAQLLAKVIIGGAQEEITLQRLMEDVHQEVVTEMQEGGVENIDEDAIAYNIHHKLAAKGAKTKALLRNDAQLEVASDFAQVMSTRGSSMAEWREEWEKAGKASKPPQMTTKSNAMMFKGGSIPVSKRAGHSSEEAEDTAVMANCMREMGTEISDVAPEVNMAADSYTVVDTELNLDQAKRMVKRSVAMNKANFKKK